MSDLIGAGWTFPARVSPAGRLRLAHGVEELDGAVRMILGTAPGERVMRPEFGCALWDQVFAPVNAATLGLIAQAAREALTRWEPRIAVDDVTAEADGESTVRVSVAYTVRATNDHRNLVYPFYVIPGEEPTA
ncbi:GPW/gp25 family protein [Actinoplanes sp. NPDC049265]|uniref:GPW/gp25 family protein n=1 Tax=Actinoplanes sp. NPDC049265 TaxID=3363902 RepID=UPI003720C662